MTSFESRTVTIRAMRDSDVPVVARLRYAAFFTDTDRTEEIDADGLRALMKGDGYEIALVAEFGGVVVGSALFVREELEAAHDRTPWLAGLVVDPRHRGRGFGAQLVRAIEVHAWNRGVQALHLYTDEAEEFYAALGWSVADRFIDNDTATVLMIRLPPA